MIVLTKNKVISLGAFLAFALGTSADEVCRLKCVEQYKDKVWLIYIMATGVKLRSTKDIRQLFMYLNFKVLTIKIEH